MGKKIIWTRPAVEGLYRVHEYILNTSKSVITADRLVQQIQKSTYLLSEYIQIHPRDPYRLNNDGSYHAYEIYRYRISYKVSTDEVYILSVRHSAQNPQFY